MHFIVINLDRRPDRWEKVQSQLKRFGAVESTDGVNAEFTFERMSAVDGKSATFTENVDSDKVSLVTKFYIKYPKLRNSHMQLTTTGGIACYFSHIKVMETFLKSSIDTIVVLEDDVILEAKFFEYLRSKKEEIQAKNAKPFVTLLASIFHNEQIDFGTAAYLLNRPAAEIIKSKAYPIEVHYDTYLNLLKSNNLLELTAEKVASTPTSLDTDIHVQYFNWKCLLSNNGLGFMLVLIVFLFVLLVVVCYKANMQVWNVKRVCSAFNRVEE
jgi:GR25 family glycosyltransferase involved in LPS biosynthesis